MIVLGPSNQIPVAMHRSVEVRTELLDEVLKSPGSLASGDVLLVLDSYAVAEDGWLARFRAVRPTIPLLAFDDGGTGGRWPVLGTIQAGLAAPARHLDSARGHFSASGAAYIPVRPDVASAASAERQTDLPGIPTILVALGAADPEHYAERIASSLAATDFDGRVVIVHGPLADPARANVDPPDSRFTLLHAPANFGSLLESAALGVTGLGNTCHELLNLGVPVAAVAVTAEQEASGTAMERLQCGTYLGRIELLDDHAIGRRIVECLFDPEEVRRQARLGRAIIDGHGAARLASHVCKTAALYFEDRFRIEEVAEEFDCSAAGIPEEHGKVRWGSMASMTNRIRLARSRIDWKAVTSWLDVGVGTGRSLVEVEPAATIERFVGVDLSREMLAFAEARPYLTPDVKLLRQSFAAHVEEEPFSLVTALGVLQQCGLSLEFAVARLGALTQSGGQLFMTTKNAAWRRFNDAGFVPDDSHHWFQPERLLRACEWGKLEIVDTGSFDPANEASSSDLTEHHSLFVLARKRA
jgi:spore coat polysaccharide biosynthesis predicted glycosyltransferase SpsG/SAM-dependent methyltransferase